MFRVNMRGNQEMKVEEPKLFNRTLVIGTTSPLNGNVKKINIEVVASRGGGINY